MIVERESGSELEISPEAAGAFEERSHESSMQLRGFGHQGRG